MLESGVCATISRRARCCAARDAAQGRTSRVMVHGVKRKRLAGAAS